MKIAFFNWRDIRHPSAGGSEAYVHEIMKRFASWGHSVSLFCSTFPGCREREKIDGIDHVRYGGKYTMYALSHSCYKRYVEGRYDAIVESINGVPFFTPLFAKEKVIAFIHQTTRENWFSGLPFPLALAGYLSEDLLLGIYRDCHAIGSSDSTRLDLEKLGFSKVRVVNPGNDVTKAQVQKEKSPTMIYIGRLAKSKNVGHAISAFRIIRESVPCAKLWVVGSGPEEKSLRDLSKDLGLEQDIVFFGHVGDVKKAELLSRSHIMLFPGTREGWGITVIESSACGTPVIGYNVPGLRDSIRPGVNGILVEKGDFRAMAKAAISLLSDNAGLGDLSRSAISYSRNFTWDRTADQFLDAINEAVK